MVGQGKSQSCATRPRTSDPNHRLGPRKLWNDTTLECRPNTGSAHSGVRAASRAVKVGAVIAGGNRVMQDIMWVAATVTFFVLSIAYVRFCDRLK